MNKTGTVLIVRLGRLGDFLVTLPAIQELRQRYSNSRLVFLTGYSTSKGVALRAASYGGDRPPWLDWIQPRWVDDVVLVDNWRSLRAWADLRRRLAELEVSKVFVLTYYGERTKGRLSKYLWLRSLTGRAHIYGIGVPSDTEQGRPGYISKQMWWALCVVGGGQHPAQVSLPRIDIAESAKAWASDFWAAKELYGRTVVALFPSGTHKHKRWPSQKFVTLANHLIDKHRARVLVVGARIDGELADAVVAGVGQPQYCINICGQTTLPQLSAVLARCSLFVGNDGGPAHLAAAVGIAGVTIMSGVHLPGVWDPSGENQQTVRVRDLDCVGCQNEARCPAGHGRCIADISPQSVCNACDVSLSAMPVPSSVS